MARELFEIAKENANPGNYSWFVHQVHNLKVAGSKSCLRNHSKTLENIYIFKDFFFAGSKAKSPAQSIPQADVSEIWPPGDET